MDAIEYEDYMASIVNMVCIFNNVSLDECTFTLFAATLKYSSALSIVCL